MHYYYYQVKWTASTKFRHKDAKVFVKDVRIHEDACNSSCVPVDCEWSSWSSWTTCTDDNDAVRVRASSTPAECRGRPCIGQHTQTRNCCSQSRLTGECVWSDWSSWSHCQNNNKRIRQRTTTMHSHCLPVPCLGNSTDESECVITPSGRKGNVVFL